jgi:ferritin-like metal-binding protein YciE
MAREQLITWLNDAYAMEQSLIPVLENHAKDADEEMPEAAERIRQHIDETRRHGERIRECLQSLGTSPSIVKSTLAYVMGTGQSVATGMFADESIKNVLSDYGAEQFEVASYSALVAAALDLGEADVASACEENLREDEAMADWLREQIPDVVTTTLHKAAGVRR